jgi:hypothetical protein
MKFQVIPVIDAMLELYQKPLAPARFRDYLKLLQGDTKDDLALPLGGFNPMAKEHARQKLQELKALDAEAIAAEVSQDLTKELALQQAGRVIGIAITLSDDLKGGWTNRYTSDYDSKFKINALLSRNFCTPVFWTGEHFSADMIRQRILEYAWRMVYRQSHEAPQTLQEHIAQEIFVAKQAPLPVHMADEAITVVKALYQHYKDSDDYHTIFNFLYGSKASSSLEFPRRFVLEDFAGFRYAALSAHH